MIREVEAFGKCEPGFAEVADVFEENFRERGELGAAFCVYHKGKPVVDLWGGYLGPDRIEPWEAHTRVNVFSVTKGIVATAYLMLQDRGAIDIDRPLADYWPEFKRGEITPRMILNHRSGLAAIDRPIDLEDFEDEDWATIEEKIRDQEPLWEPDKEQGYHIASFGLLLGVLFRKVAGERIGSFVARELAEPMGLNLTLGMRPSENEKIATVIPPSLGRLGLVAKEILNSNSEDGAMFRQGITPGSVANRAAANPRELGSRGLQNYNDRRVMGLELPWSNAVADARSIARLYNMLVCDGAFDGVQMMSPETVRAVHGKQSWTALDLVVRRPIGWSQGFQKERYQTFHSSPSSFGHTGFGGAMGWADPEYGLAFSYVMNRMTHQYRSFRMRSVVKAMYRAVRG